MTRKSRREFLKNFSCALGLSLFKAKTAEGNSQSNYTGSVIVGETQKEVWINVNAIPPGEFKAIIVRDRTLLIWHRNLSEIENARALDFQGGWKDETTVFAGVKAKLPAFDKFRSVEGVWGVFWAFCSKEGCLVKPTAGQFTGFLCPCCRSKFDISGRVQSGPAPRNLMPVLARLNEDKSILRISKREVPRRPPW